MGDHDELMASLRRERGADTPHARYLDERLTEAQRENAELRAENTKLREHLAGSCTAGDALRGLRDAIDSLASECKSSASRYAAIAGESGTDELEARREGYAEAHELLAAKLRGLLAGQEKTPPPRPLAATLRDARMLPGIRETSGTVPEAHRSASGTQATKEGSPS